MKRPARAYNWKTCSAEDIIMTTLRIRLLLPGVLALFAAGCGSKPQTPAASSSAAPSAAMKRYSMHGKVISVNASDKSARIDAGEISGWMSAMTMDYPVREAADLAKLTADKIIDATVFVDGDNFWIGEVKVVEAKDAAAASPSDAKK